ncbi:MAG: radical SAM protein, partial [Planctomycetes bacterium]|nr:radical SAM protein [Planctomycetota bacterium]
MTPADQSNIYADHSRNWKENRYVYPVISRRSHGLSIGVNLNPDKACNFDCVYCQVDRAVPGKFRSVDLNVLRIELEHMIRMTLDQTLFAE